MRSPRSDGRGGGGSRRGGLRRSLRTRTDQHARGAVGARVSRHPRILGRHLRPSFRASRRRSSRWRGRPSQHGVGARSLPELDRAKPIPPRSRGSRPVHRLRQARATGRAGTRSLATGTPVAAPARHPGRRPSRRLGDDVVPPQRDRVRGRDRRQHLRRPARWVRRRSERRAEVHRGSVRRRPGPVPARVPGRRDSPLPGRGRRAWGQQLRGIRRGDPAGVQSRAAPRTRGRARLRASERRGCDDRSDRREGSYQRRLRGHHLRRPDTRGAAVDRTVDNPLGHPLVALTRRVASEAGLGAALAVRLLRPDRRERGARREVQGRDRPGSASAACFPRTGSATTRRGARSSRSSRTPPSAPGNRSRPRSRPTPTRTRARSRPMAPST